jgi:hypothetical protein
MSSNHYWTQVDGNFYYEDFFWAIVGLFDDSEGQRFLICYHRHPTVGIRPSCTMSSLYYLTPHP